MNSNANISCRRKNPPGRNTKAEFLQRLKQEYFLDILRARSHSKHFRHTRAQYINSRVRSIAFLLGLLIPAWIMVDMLYLSEEALYTIATLRGITGVACLGLGLWSGGNHNLRLARIKLALLILIPSVFQTAAHLYLEQIQHSLPAGYHFFPFMIISLSAIFPLTIMEGGFISSSVVALYMLTTAYLGQLFSLDTLNDIWLLVLLALIAGWAALTQLTMLMRLYRQAHRDSLTGLANRRSIMNYLKREVTYCQSNKNPLTIMLFDLDRFKSVNDQYGHATGDEVLKHFADMAISESRSEDLVGRFGGEEFLMILTDTELASAEKIAERFRFACQALRVDVPDGEAIRFTTSIGVAQLQPGEKLVGLLKRVDDALYAAKGNGRDRVVVA